MVAGIFQIGFRNPQGMCYLRLIIKYVSQSRSRGGDWFVANYGENYGWKILGWIGTGIQAQKLDQSGNQIYKSYKVLGAIYSGKLYGYI